MFSNILHLCFAKRAKLNALRSLNPIPPSDFGLHNFSQETQVILLSLPFCPHQKLPIIEFNSVHRESGSLKTLIVYVGNPVNSSWTKSKRKTTHKIFDWKRLVNQLHLYIYIYIYLFPLNFCFCLFWFPCNILSPKTKQKWR